MKLFPPRCRFHPSTADPFEDRAILPALLIPMPPLSAVVRGEIVADVACAVCWPGWLDQHEALGWVVDVYYVHGVLIVVFAVLVGEDALIVGWTQLKDYVAGVAEDAGFAVRALRRQNGFDLGYEVVEVEHGAGLHVL